MMTSQETLDAIATKASFADAVIALLKEMKLVRKPKKRGPKKGGKRKGKKVVEAEAPKPVKAHKAKKAKKAKAAKEKPAFFSGAGEAEEE